MKSGNLYKLHVSGKDLANVFWKTPTSAIGNIPSSSLLPDFTQAFTTEAYTKLLKTAIIAEVFEIGAEEFEHFAAHGSDFGDLDFNELSFEHWLRLEAYIRFRDSLPQTDTNILEFFNWTHNPDDPTLLSEKIAELTLWEQSRIEQLIAEVHFNLDRPEAFHNEINLLKLQKALVVADKIAMDIDLLFQWAKPTSNFKKCRKIADSIQHAFRAKYQQEDWEEVVKPLNDIIRNHSEDALVAYCLQLPEIIDWGVEDAEGLFEYFLIDVKMDACMETSRIKQGLSSIQLFIQRCFLGLEEEHNGITPEVLDRERWEWMQRYRVWEANRKVFLYPENWIESNLRDDKSPFFQELEGELLQNDINTQNISDALKSYLYKVDEVANMEIVGLYIEGQKNANLEWEEGSKLHVFGRTRSAPYFFYYRYLALDQENWQPWEKMQVDIPSYDITGSDNKIVGNGCYVAPAIWNGRLIVAFPQFMKKTRPADTGNTKFTDMANDSSPNDNKPIDYWEIKMGISEYRNRKWTQKVLSKDALYHENGANLPDLKLYEFIPVPSAADLRIRALYNGGSLPDSQHGFMFGVGGGFELLTASPGNNSVTVNDFHHNNGSIVSLQISNDVNEHLFNDTGLTTYNFSNFNIPYMHDLMGLVNRPKLKQFFRYNLSLNGVNKDDAFGRDGTSFHELKRPYALYNWELFFHTPMMLANATSEAQQFEEAMKMYHNVFHPMADGPDDKRFWQFSPFKELDTQNILDAIFNNLEPGTANAAIHEWRENPFMPHLVARSRPVAYMKWVVMKYIDNLIAWGDYLFRQDTIESINQASQLYILAYHILGRRPHMIPKRGKILPQTYNSLLGKWDAFSNAMVELEIALPFSNQTSLPFGIDNGVVGMANIFGFSSSLYFCIPNNPKLMGYWDTIEDRLFKIRHCLNIEGVFRKLALFEPPIDPALLVKAAAHGLSIASVLNDLNTPMPNYRFLYLLRNSIELCNELKSLGNSMLTAIEKKDAEAFSLIRAKHESTMQNLIMEVRKKQLEEAEKALDNLMENRKSPVQRMQYYLELIGEDPNKVPGIDADFTVLANGIDAPVDESGIKVNKYEKEDMDKAKEAHDLQDAIGKVESLASVLHAIPTIGAFATPIGPNRSG
ncbi:MAG: neuraminidase-like domain-containing protein, partial [Bacteroidota bacterium]